MDLTSDTALVVVDCQNDFAAPDGSLYVDGAVDVIAEVNRLVVTAGRADGFVVYTQDWHPPDTPHFEKDGGIWPVHCVAGTSGAEFHPDLIAEGPFVRKGVGGEDGYSGFTMVDVESGEETSTGLQELLTERGIGRVVVVGLALDYCVKATALDSVGFGFETLLPVQATAAVNLEEGDDDTAVRELQNAGVAIL